MFCYYCGAKLPDDSRFCPECGTKLNYGSAPAEPAPQPTPEAAPVYVQSSAEQTQAPVYAQPIPVPQVQEVEPVYVQPAAAYTQPAQVYAQPVTPQPQSQPSGVSVVRRTVRPLGGIIIMFFAIANALLAPTAKLAFTMINVRNLVFNGTMLLAAIFILLGMFLHHHKGNILTGIGTLLLLAEPVYYVILNGKTVRWFFYFRGESTSEIVYRVARATMFFSYFLLIFALIFIALYYLIGGKTFGNPLKLFCGLGIIIFGGLYGISLITLLLSSNGYLPGRYTVYVILTNVSIIFFWLFTGLSLIIYTPFKKVRK